MITPILDLRRRLRVSAATKNTFFWRPTGSRTCSRIPVSSRSVHRSHLLVAEASQKHVERIRSDYRADLRNKITQLRMRTTAMYFIDVLALQAGNDEKGEDEVDTIGCCSLRCKHVTLEPPNYIIFDSPSEDSIRYYNKVTVDEPVLRISRPSSATRMNRTSCLIA
jgi:DNA topoisomerase IB